MRTVARPGDFVPGTHRAAPCERFAVMCRPCLAGRATMALGREPRAAFGQASGRALRPARRAERMVEQAGLQAGARHGLRVWSVRCMCPPPAGSAARGLARPPLACFDHRRPRGCMDCCICARHGGHGCAETSRIPSSGTTDCRAGRGRRYRRGTHGPHGLAAHTRQRTACWNAARGAQHGGFVTVRLLVARPTSRPARSGEGRQQPWLRADDHQQLSRRQAGLPTPSRRRPH